MHRSKIIVYLLFTFLFLVSCESNGQHQKKQTTLHDDFDTYWYGGKAELNSYELEQARYGEIHKGEAVLIFVTEDISKTKQVKLDDPFSAGDDKVKVLKLNFTKKFYTGIYPYSMMRSTFTPVDMNKYPSSLKSTITSQEWCGHTFTQFNLRFDQYHIQSYSYFESEGDKKIVLKSVFLEDEIWNKIRLDPKILPTGTFDIIPDNLYQRLRHTEFKVEKAEATNEETKMDKFPNTPLMVYSLAYKNGERSLRIYYTKAFPHEILYWEETYTSGFGDKAVKLTTKATRKASKRLDYWNKNKNKDAILRKNLKLQY